jgi:3-oxoacyl-[acyl-carrier protein] reductase
MYAIVTGSSRGIGAAIATRLATDGFDIVLNCRSRSDEAETVAQAIRALGRDATLLPFDVTDRAKAREALTALLEQRGAPAAVVLNAGITRDCLLGMMGEDDWDAVLATGLDGFYNVLRPLIAAMLRARSGRIVTIASVSGQVGNAGQVNYSAAKGGLIAATKALARESAKRNVTVNCVAPGLIRTDMTKDLPLEQMLTAVPMGRIGTVEDVAHAVGFLCSPGAGYITGQVLGVNGGLVT